MAFLVLETLLIAVFVVLDRLLFYVFFESVLIPLFLIVGIWGGSATRVRAAFLLFVPLDSLFMLLAFLVIYYNVGSTDFQVVSLSEMNLESQKLLWLAVFISMAIQTPLLPFHVWLPRAHAEAPLVQTIAVITLIYASLATLRQTYLKALVAYSSIGHVVLGLFSKTIQGIDGALLLSLAHGVVSFLLVGG